MGATMEGMVGEKRILPERSEWFRSRGIIGIAHTTIVVPTHGLNHGVDHLVTQVQGVTLTHTMFAREERQLVEEPGRR